MKDAWGRELRVGDICAYPVRRGSRMWVNRITIQALTRDVAGNPRVKGINKDGANVVISNLENLTLIGRNNTIPLMEDEEEGDEDE
jgi:hypothetical protein